MRFTQIQEFIRFKAYKTRNYCRNYGLWKSILHFFECLGFTFKNLELVLFEINIDDTSFTQKNENTIDLARVEKEDIENAKEYLDEWFSRDNALKRLEKGHLLFVVKDGDKMIFYQWVELKEVSIPFIDLSFSIPDDKAYMAYIYTVPDYRGKGIASKAKPFILKHLQENGYRKVFLAIAPDNLPSIRVNKKAGFKEYQTVLYRRFLFLKYYCVTDYNTNLRKVSLSIRGTDQHLWKIFSKTD